MLHTPLRNKYLEKQMRYPPVAVLKVLLTRGVGERKRDMTSVCIHSSTHFLHDKVTTTRQTPDVKRGK